jgi:hypothetical protein
MIKIWQSVYVEEYGLPYAKDEVHYLPMCNDTMCGEREFGNRCPIRYIYLSH